MLLFSMFTLLDFLIGEYLTTILLYILNRNENLNYHKTKTKVKAIMCGG